MSMLYKHKELINSNRLFLVKCVKITPFLLSSLRKDHILTGEMEEMITANNSTSGQVAALLDLLEKRSDKAFAAFICALVDSHQENIAERLDVGLTSKYLAERQERERIEAAILTGSENNVARTENLMQDQRLAYHPMAGFPPGAQFFVINPNASTPGMTQGPYNPANLPNFRQDETLGYPVPAQEEHREEGTGASNYRTDNVDIKQIKAEINGDPIMNFKVVPCKNKHLAESPMVYPMRSIPHGRAVIISNKYFIHPEWARDGAEHDVANLKNLFTQLNFDVAVYEDKTARVMKEIIKDEQTRASHSPSPDAFIMFILSHGNLGIVYGIDGEEVRIEDDITDKFDGASCPSLDGKPKVFFVQACQGDCLSSLHGVYKVDCDSEVPTTDNASLELSEEMLQKFEKLKVLDESGYVPLFHEKQDMLMAYATVKGYKAWRRSDLGSWFVRCICDVFARQAHQKHLVDLLTEVNFILTQLQAEMNGGIYRQVAEKKDSFTKSLYFFPDHF